MHAQSRVKFNHFATGLLATDVQATMQFYVEHFGSEKKIDVGWFVSVGHDNPA